MKLNEKEEHIYFGQDTTYFKNKSYFTTSYPISTTIKQSNNQNWRNQEFWNAKHISCSTTKRHSIKINIWRESPNQRTTKGINQGSYIPTYHIWCIDIRSTTMWPRMRIHFCQHICGHLQQKNGTTNESTTGLLNWNMDNRSNKIISC